MLAILNKSVKKTTYFQKVQNWIISNMVQRGWILESHLFLMILFIYSFFKSQTNIQSGFMFIAHSENSILYILKSIHLILKDFE